MFEEYCFVLLLNNKETANSLNEEQASCVKGIESLNWTQNSREQSDEYLN